MSESRAAAILVRDVTRAELADLVTLAVGLRDHLGQTLPSRATFETVFARLLAANAARFFLAVGADGALGYVQCRYRDSAWSGGLAVELEDVFVSPAARGRGVGRALLEHVLADARRGGVRLAGVTTNERNAPALALYGSLGFSAERARWQGGRQLWLERALEQL